MPSYWHREVLRDNVSMAFGETYEYDLPKSGILGSLVAYISSTQNGQPFLTAVRKWRLVDYISQIELMGDGSVPIKSFDGVEALAAAFYDDFREPACMWRHYSNTPHRQWIPIHMGRHFMDEEYALDLSRFEQVKLNILNDASATEFTTDIKLTLIAYWLREGVVVPRGYFREEVWKSWAPTAGEWEYSHLPVALPIRRILLEARPAVDTADAKNNSTMHELMDDVEFTYRTGGLRVWRGSLNLLGFLSIMEMPALAQTMAMIDRNDELGFDVGVGYVIGGVKSQGTYTDAPAAYPNTIAAADIQDSAQEVKSRTADTVHEGLFRGYGYGHCVPLFYARKPELVDILDPEVEKVVDVNVQTKAAITVTGTDRNARNGIILSRLVR